MAGVAYEQDLTHIDINKQRIDDEDTIAVDHSNNESTIVLSGIVVML